MPIANVNDCEFYYQIEGAGPEVVFIHGEDHNIDLFEHQMAHFSKLYCCITYDRRGHGKSQLTAYGYSLHNQTIDLIGLLDYLQFERVVAGVHGRRSGSCYPPNRALCRSTEL